MLKKTSKDFRFSKRISHFFHNFPMTSSSDFALPKVTKKRALVDHHAVSSYRPSSDSFELAHYRGKDEEDEEPQHTGLSPRMSRMELPKKRKTDSPVNCSIPYLFYLGDDDVETYEAGDELRLRRGSRADSVHELFLALNRRVERAALEAGIARNDPSVLGLTHKLVNSAARLEAFAAKRYEPDQSSQGYRSSVIKISDWIDAATDNQLKEVLEGSNSTDDTVLLENSMLESDTPTGTSYFANRQHLEIEMLEL